jgi:hypothetical protein
LYATQADHAEKVLDLVLPADHEPTKMMEPGEKSRSTRQRLANVRSLPYRIGLELYRDLNRDAQISRESVFNLISLYASSKPAHGQTR